MRRGHPGLCPQLPHPQAVNCSLKGFLSAVLDPGQAWLSHHSVWVLATAPPRPLQSSRQLWLPALASSGHCPIPIGFLTPSGNFHQQQLHQLLLILSLEWALYFLPVP